LQHVVTRYTNTCIKKVSIIIQSDLSPLSVPVTAKKCDCIFQSKLK